MKGFPESGSAMLVCAIVCLLINAGCQQKEEVIYTVNAQYSVVLSPACNCKVLKKAAQDGTMPVLAEHVTYVMGNAQEFLVQTRPPQAINSTWHLLRDKAGIQPSDLEALPDNDAIDSVLTSLSIKFAKDLNDY